MKRTIIISLIKRALILTLATTVTSTTFAQSTCGPLLAHYSRTQQMSSSSYNALLSLINRLNTLSTYAQLRTRVYDARLEQAHFAAQQSQVFAQSIDCAGIDPADEDDCAFAIRSAGNRLRAAYVTFQREQLARERFLVSSQTAIYRQQARVALEQQRYDQTVAERQQAKASLDQCTTSGGNANPADETTQSVTSTSVTVTTTGGSSTVHGSSIQPPMAFPTPFGM